MIAATPSVKHAARSSDGAFAVIARPRIYLSGGIAIGPGKVDLLGEVAKTHSISAAARALGLTYKRAWLLIDELNRGFGQPVVLASTGGKGGGGARLTPLGEALVERYCALQAKLDAIARPELEAFRDLC